MKGTPRILAWLIVLLFWLIIGTIANNYLI